MYSSLLHGENTHKVTDLSANPIMRLYYSRVGMMFMSVRQLNFLLLQPVLFTFCAGNELFFASLYILYFTPGYEGISPPHPVLTVAMTMYFYTQ